MCCDRVICSKIVAKLKRPVSPGLVGASFLIPKKLKFPIPRKKYDKGDPLATLFSICCKALALIDNKG